ncbi:MULTISPECIES: YxeA family protein [Cytobacillus]|uniref:YxeA family protein n=1 Tax=Cytobacillus TaxID=2675230 RepID=UPI00203ABC3B|nr:YxeA family protein [Cytobacillus firmus]MCM3707945.1 YxeA family protein [Cytobacillus firmus]
MKSFVGVLFAIVILIAGLFIIVPKEDMDHFNPLIAKDEVYVQINEEAVPKGSRYEYTLIGYNEEGEEKEITFGSGKVLRENAFLKVEVKGSFVDEWEEVQAGELPAKAAAKLK